jgi:hypothetical protein
MIYQTCINMFYISLPLDSLDIIQEIKNSKAIIIIIIIFIVIINKLYNK